MFNRTNEVLENGVLPVW